MFDSDWDNMLHGIGCPFAQQLDDALVLAPYDYDDAWEPILLHGASSPEWTSDDVDFLMDALEVVEYPTTPSFSPTRTLLDDARPPASPNHCSQHSTLSSTILSHGVVSSPCPFRHDEAFDKDDRDTATMTPFILQPVMDGQVIRYPSPLVTSGNSFAVSTMDTVTSPGDKTTNAKKKTAAKKKPAPRRKKKKKAAKIKSQLKAAQEEPAKVTTFTFENGPDALPQPTVALKRRRKGPAKKRGSQATGKPLRESTNKENKKKLL